MASVTYRDVTKMFGDVVAVKDLDIEIEDKFLRENREEPMFIYYPMVLVHNPPNIPPGKAPDE
ncbi:MAG: hypothetical protein ABFQ89_05770, partial [Chloroflexota bacterium]